MGNNYHPRISGDGGFAIPQDIKVENGKIIIDWLLPDGKHIFTTSDFDIPTFDKYKGYLTDDEMKVLDTKDYTGGEFCFNHSIEYGIYMYEFVVEGTRREWTQDATANWISRTQLEDEGIILKSYATRQPKAGDFIFKSLKDKIKIYDWSAFENDWIESGEISHSFHADYFYANKIDGGFRQINDNGLNINVHKIATTPNSQMYGDPRSENVFIGADKNIVLVRDNVQLNVEITSKTNVKKIIPLETFGEFDFTLKDTYLGLSRVVRPTKLSFYVDKLLDKDGVELNESVFWFSITDITNIDVPKVIFETNSITSLPLGIGKTIYKGKTDIEIDVLNYLIVGNKYRIRVCCLASQKLKGEILDGSFVPKSNFNCRIVEEHDLYNESNLTNEVIRDKLSELEGENRLDASCIKNLPDIGDLTEVINELRLAEQNIAILQKSLKVNTDTQRLDSIKTAILNHSIQVLNSK